MDIDDGAIGFAQSSGRRAQTAGDEVDKDRTQHTPEVDIPDLRRYQRREQARLGARQFRPDKHHDKKKNTCDERDMAVGNSSSEIK